MIFKLKKTFSNSFFAVGFFIFSLNFTRLRLLSSGKKGQTVVEYMLMLATIAAMAVIFGVYFYDKILGGFFTIIGMTIGAGKPA